MTVVALGLPVPRHAPPATAEPDTDPFDSGVTTDMGGAPSTGPLRDRFGRVVRDLRVSVTDRCNLRCTYCMPAEGLPWMETDRVLTADEFVRVIGVAVRELGIRSVRFTGGEPLLRRDLETIIGGVSALDDAPEIALTTNALGLARRIDGLVAAGLSRINVSLDTVDPARFSTITRRDRFDDVVAGLAAARAAGVGRIKVNAVVPTADDLPLLPDLLAFCLENGYELRVIEQMPLDADHRWDRRSMVTADAILARLRTRFTLLDDPFPRGSTPAQTWLVDGYSVRDAPAQVGVIAAVTRSFCGDCDRARLTADGALRNCLFADSESDLRSVLRSGASDRDIDDAIVTTWRRNAWAKRAGHGVDDDSFIQPARPMSAIGG